MNHQVFNIIKFKYYNDTLIYFYSLTRTPHDDQNVSLGVMLTLFSDQLSYKIIKYAHGLKHIYNKIRERALFN